MDIDRWSAHNGRVSRTWTLSEGMYSYMIANSLREPDVMRRLRAATAAMPNAIMQISPEQGQFMALLVELLSARRIIEVGTFTGYSALAMARALPDDGKIVTCDVSEEYAAVGRPFWREAGVEDRIEVRIGPAVDTLAALRTEGEGRFDFAFIDADKTNYLAYYEACVALIRPGGLVAVDNVFWVGSVADPTDQEESTEAIRKLNAHIHQDPRVSVSMLPLGDGLYLARKR